MPIGVDQKELSAAEALLLLRSASKVALDIDGGATLVLSCPPAPTEGEDTESSLDNKHYVKEQKKLMERDDHQVKNVLSLCMRTIRDMKSGSDPVYPGLSSDQPLPGPSRPVSVHPAVADADTDTSGSDPGVHYDVGRRHIQSTASHNGQYKRDAASNGRHGQTSRHETPNPRSRAMICRTPVSAINGSYTPVSAVNGSHTPVLTCDQGTQTDPLPDYEDAIQKMEVIIKQLYSRFIGLVAIIEKKQNENEDASLSNGMSDTAEPNNTESSEPEQNGTSSSPEQNVSNATGENSNGHPMQGESTSNPGILQVRRVSAHTTNTGEPSHGDDHEMVPIGAGYAVVPIRLLNDIDWTCHSTATRQLMQSVFTRREMATSSLTGKPSPAFANKRAKERLDPLKVNDIVDTVAERCGVPKRLVRCSITTKCTDESKLYRNRQQYQKARQKQNQENPPPATPSSDES